MMIQLPLNLDPPVKCYPQDAQALGIIFTQGSDKCYPWLYNYYYNFDKTNVMTHFPDVWWFLNDTVFKLHSINLPMELVPEKTTYDLIIQMFSKGYYCVGAFNENYTPGFALYNKNPHFDHPFMLFGYDEGNESFLARGYSTRGFLENIEIKMSAFYKSLLSSRKDGIDLIFVKLNPDHDYNYFDMGKFENSIKEYLSPKYEKAGIKTMYLIIEDITKQKENYESIDIRMYYVLYEHFSLMAKRLQYMQSQKLIKDDVIESYLKLVDEVVLLKNLAIKYNITLNGNIIDRMCNELLKVIEQDEKLLTCILDS